MNHNNSGEKYCSEIINGISFRRSLTSGIKRLMDGMLLNSMAFRHALTAALVDDYQIKAKRTH